MHEPLVCVPQVLEKVWGGRRLERFGKSLPKTDAMYGESWELADMGATSASGAGGGAFRSVIQSGALAGKTIGDAIRLWGDDLTDRAILTPTGEFPLLIKLLDARESLSVQVHPSPAYAAAHPAAHLKTECWYILDAEPGSELFIGLKPGVSRAEFERLVRSGSSEIVDVLARRPAIRGELHDLPSGTVHAMGAGVVVAEVQTPSDTTFRVYDWGRVGRQMHIDEAIASALDTNPPAPASRPTDAPEAVLVDTPFFVVREVRLTSVPRPLTRDDERAPVIVMGVSGQAALSVGDARWLVRPGATVLVPRATVESATLAGEPDGLEAAQVLLVEPRATRGA